VRPLSASPLVDAQDFDDLRYIAGMCQKRAFEIPRRVRWPRNSFFSPLSRAFADARQGETVDQDGVPLRSQAASSRQPAILPSYGTGEIRGL
jgi:hypothetical protein